MKRRWRELALVAITAALMLALSVQLRRAEPLPTLPTPPATTVFVASPQMTTRCSGVGFPGNPPRKIVDVRPVYPLTARRARVSGVVLVEVEIDEQGHVSHPRVVRSVPLLDQAALDAVAIWQFEPATLRGRPGCVTMTLTVEFPPE